MKKETLKILSCERVKTEVGCGNMYVILGHSDGALIELFAVLGKAGGCGACFNEALSRMITLASKYSVPVNEIVAELMGIQCPSPHLVGGDDEALSCPDAIAKVMAKEDK